MTEVNSTAKKLLEMIAALDKDGTSAYNIRQDSGCAGRQSTKNIQITPKEGGSGIDITVAPGCKGEKVYIPACVTHSDVNDVAYNDFYIGDDSDVVVIAGCGVHADGHGNAQHNGIHRFFVGKNAHVLYEEKHIGTGEGTGKRIINPETYIELGENSTLRMDTVQIEGVDSTVRNSKAVLAEGAKLIIKEKIMTHDDQLAETNFVVDLNGEGSVADLVSRSVAKDHSTQVFRSVINGNSKCTGHSECDAIIMDSAKVSAIPELTASVNDAELIHEAAIGKIAGEQITKLMTLGLTETEAEARIIQGFMK